MAFKVSRCGESYTCASSGHWTPSCLPAAQLYQHLLSSTETLTHSVGWPNLGENYVVVIPPGDKDCSHALFITSHQPRMPVDRSLGRR